MNTNDTHSHELNSAELKSTEPATETRSKQPVPNSIPYADEVATTAVHDGATDVAIEGQPLETLQLGDSQLTILGTAHVSKASADAVTQLIQTGDFDAVAIELDDNRYASLTNPNTFAEMDLFKVMREGKVGMVAASLALGAFQQRLAEQYDIESGAEMRAAIKETTAKDIPLWLIDRDIGTTLRRVYANVPWWQRLNIFTGLMAGVFTNEEISEEDIEALKEGDVLEATFTEFADKNERIFTPLIAERDSYMALRLRQESQKNQQSSDNPMKKVLVVIGAGHLKGMVAKLQEDAPENVQASLEQLQQSPQGNRWWRIIPWAITALIIIGFIIGFSRSPELGWSLVRDWVLFNGVLAGIGALIALAHPLTILGSLLAAPLTSLNPLIGAGYVGAGIELFLRKPKVGDFASLRSDVTQWRGWWKNRVARILLTFLLVSLGSALGTWLAGFKIFGRLA